MYPFFKWTLWAIIYLLSYTTIVYYRILSFAIVYHTRTRFPVIPHGRKYFTRCAWRSVANCCAAGSYRQSKNKKSELKTVTEQGICHSRDWLRATEKICRKNTYPSLSFFFSRFHFPACRQAVVTGLVPSSLRFLPSIFHFAYGCAIPLLSMFHRLFLTRALALSASQFVHMKKSQRIYTRLCTRRGSNSRSWPVPGSRITWYATVATGYGTLGRDGDDRFSTKNRRKNAVFCFVILVVHLGHRVFHPHGSSYTFYRTSFWVKKDVS